MDTVKSESVYWRCPCCGNGLSCSVEDDIYDIRFDTSRDIGSYVTFHHCGNWRKAKIESIREEEYEVME